MGEGQQFAGAVAVEDQMPPGHAPAWYNIPDTANDIQWNQWINLEMCGPDSMAEAEVAPPLRNMVIRPVEFRGSYCGVVGGC